MEHETVRPDFPTVSPYIILRDAAKALEFYREAFGADVITRQVDADGGVRHGEFRIGDSTFMITSGSPEFPAMKPLETFGGSPVQFFLYVNQVDERFAQALKAGATEFMALENQPYGRSGGVQDPFGLVWWLSTHTDMSGG